MNSDGGFYLYIKTSNPTINNKNYNFTLFIVVFDVMILT